MSAIGWIISPFLLFCSHSSYITTLAPYVFAGIPGFVESFWGVYRRDLIVRSFVCKISIWDWCALIGVISNHVLGKSSRTFQLRPWVVVRLFGTSIDPRLEWILEDRPGIESSPKYRWIFSRFLNRDCFHFTKTR